VGDLDRVIQVNHPPSVAAFLQRSGRTGRREGTIRNCLFLAVDTGSLLWAAGLLQLWGQGYVEPVVAPPQPRHIVAQQLLALVQLGSKVAKTAAHVVPAQLSARADRVLERIRAADGDVALFSHGHMLRSLGARWIGVPITAGTHLMLSTASVSVLGYERESPVIRLWNGRAHLSEFA